MSTIRMLGDRSAARVWIALAIRAGDRWIGEGQLRQAVAQNPLGLGIGDEGLQGSPAHGHRLVARSIVPGSR